MIRFLEDAKRGQLCVAAIARSGYVSGDCAGGYSLSSTPIHKLLESVLTELILFWSVRLPNGWGLLSQEDTRKAEKELPNVARRHAIAVAKLIAEMPAGEIDVDATGSTIRIVHRETRQIGTYRVPLTTFSDVGMVAPGE